MYDQLKLCLCPVFSLFNMLHEDCVFDAVRRLSVAGSSLSDQGLADSRRLCEVGKAAVLEFAYDLVRSSTGRPLLY